MEWRDLLPKDAEVVLASTGNFEFENDDKPCLGTLALTHDKIYVILFKGIAMLSPWMHASIPLKDLRGVRVTGSLVRSLEFDYSEGGESKRVDFISLDAEVREILGKIEYEADNAKV